MCFCFQISDFSFVLEASIFEKILLFIYINIFIYINNEKLRITQPSKIKLKTEIWKQSIVSLPELGLIWFDNISIFTRLSLTFHQMNVDLLSWSGLLLSWKSLLCTDKVYFVLKNLTMKTLASTRTGHCPAGIFKNKISNVTKKWGGRTRACPLSCPAVGAIFYKHNEGCKWHFSAACSLQLLLK